MNIYVVCSIDLALDLVLIEEGVVDKKVREYEDPQGPPWRVTGPFRRDTTPGRTPIGWLGLFVDVWCHPPVSGWPRGTWKGNLAIRLRQ